MLQYIRYGNRAQKMHKFCFDLLMMDTFGFLGYSISIKVTHWNNDRSDLLLEQIVKSANWRRWVILLNWVDEGIFRNSLPLQIFEILFF